MKELSILIEVPDRSLYFIGLIHKTDSENKRIIGKEFYDKYCTEITAPRGVHHEIQLLGDISKLPNSDHIHYYQPPSSIKNFVCWTGSLPTINTAHNLFIQWCVGTAYTVYYGEDFSGHYSSNAMKFLYKMREEFGINMIAKR